MSTTIDQKVVEMRFDNKQFETNVQTSMSSIEKLKKGLDFNGAAKGLENINSSVKNCNVSVLGDAVEAVRVKFSALEVMAMSVLSNITNTLLNAGKKFISALTIDPIKMGFQEYETQMNAVQTILANTQSRQKEVKKEGVKSVEEVALAAGQAAQSATSAQNDANAASLDNLRDTNKQKLKAYEDLAEDEVDALEDKFDKESDALADAIEAETESLEKAHRDKLALYEEEYMQKLKVIDEEKYNKIKAIDSEISGINKQTEAEEKLIKLAEQRERLSELQSKVNAAENIEDRMEAEKRLNDYQQDIARKSLIEERDAQIDNLKIRKETIEAEYDLAAENLKAEYDAKTTQENDLYKVVSENLKDEQSEREKSLQKIYQTERELLTDRHSDEKEAIRDLQEAQIEALNKTHQVSLANIKAQQEAAVAAASDTSGQYETITTEASTLEDVNAALDELNSYADKTIYNFSEMAKNIGTFTAAGVDLDTSVSAIKGIANLAALSGTSAEKASGAMYQLSQAVQNGTLKYQDWISVNTAGMGGAVFQDSLKETARVHGIEVDKMIRENGSFQLSLQEGWLSADILTETLSKFTGDLNAEQLKAIGYTDEQVASIMTMAQTASDAAQKVKTFTQLFGTLKESAQSGWANSWEIIVGDFEEAKALLTDINDILGGIIQKSADSRNKLLEGWKEMGGRESLIEAARNAFEGILSIIKPIKDAFREFFPPMTVKQLVGFTEGLKTLTSHLKISEETASKIWRTFRGVFAVLDIVGRAFSAVFDAIKPLFGGIDDLGGRILTVTAGIGDWLVNLNNLIKKNDVFSTIIQAIIDFVKKLIDKVIELVQKISPKFEIFHAILERVHERMSQIGEVAGAMQFGVVTALEAIGAALTNCKFFQLMTAIWDLVKGVGIGIGKVLGKITSGFIDKLGNADFNGILDLINSLSIGGIALAISKFLGSFTTSFKSMKDMLDGVTGILDGVRGSLEAFQTQLKAGTLLKIAIAVGILAAAILVISLIDSNKLAGAIAAITALFADLIASMALLTTFSGGIKGALKAVTLLNGIAIAVLILAGALSIVGQLNPEQLEIGITGIVGLMASMIAAAKILGSGGKNMANGAVQMVIFAEAIKILAGVCADLAKLSWEEIAKGLAGVGVLMAEISIFLRTAKFGGKAITTATGIVILAAAIKILASACKDFGELSWEQLAKGMASIGVLLGEIVAFTKLMGDAKHVVSAGVALIAIGAAMKIFASALNDMGGMKWEELAKGLAGMAGVLLAVTLALNFMPKNMVGIGVGLMAVSAALLILAEALGKMGSLSWEQIGKGLTVLGGAIAILAIGLNAMKGTLAGSAALLVAVAALVLLTPVLSILGAMSWESIVKGLVAMAGAFAVIGLAGLVLGPVVPAILGVAGAFALIGVGVLALGVGLFAAGLGLTAIATGFTALAVAGAAGATAFVAALAVIITGLLELGPMIVEKIAEMFVTFCNAIAAEATALGEVLKTLVLTLLDVLVTCLPAIVDAALELLIALFTALVDKAPTLVDLLYKFIIALFDGVARNLPELTKSVVNLFMTLFTSVFEALKGIDVEVLIKGIAGIGLMAGIMAALAAVALITPLAMLGVVGMGAVIAELALMLAAVGALSQIPGLLWLVNEGAELMAGIGNSLGAFIGGIVGGIMEGVSSKFPQIGKDLSEFMVNAKPFIEGAGKITKSTMDGVTSLVGAIVLLTGANVLNGLTSWFTGGSSLSDFGKELAEFGPYFSKYYESIKGIKGPVIEASANAAKALSEMAKNMPNSGGVSGWFFGENSIADFAEELVKFGPKLKKYADSVDGLDADVVVNSANAAKALSEMAKNLPNKGGVLAEFVGENSLAAFAEELVIFGPSLKKYADSVSGLDSNVVANSANAAKALSELAENLPNTGGVAGWFAGDNNISTFGKSLVSFGESFAQYYRSVNDIDQAKLSAVIDETGSLINIVSSISNVDAEAATTFSDSLKNLGQNGVKSFVNAFTDSTAKVKKAATDMIASFIDGANSKKQDMVTALSTLIQNVIDAVNKKKMSFYNAAVEFMNNLVTGAKSKDKNTSISLTNIVVNAINSINKKYNDFYNSGAYLFAGFVKGVQSKTTEVETKSKEMAKAAVTAAAKALEIKSPSKAFYRLGAFTGQGFVNALIDYKDKSYDAANSMATYAKDGLSGAISKISDLINNGIDTEPTIRPVMDLTDVQNGANKLHNMMSGAYSLSGSVDTARKTANSMNQALGNKHVSQSGASIDSLNKAIQELIANPSKILENTFNITGNNPKEIAEEVSRIIQHQVERRDAIWE